jgi:hypothetical protein
MALTILLGCLSIGGRSDNGSVHESESASTCEQDGSILLGPGEERDIYYPAPYVSPPYLDLGPGAATAGCQLLAQQPTHFRVHNTSRSANFINWKARGVKGKVTQTIVPVSGTPTPVPADATPESTGKDR